jgi:gamma-glutamylcyclotransferase (GGCT)/AIG2-like uncharacterized protein YtfP
MSSQPTSIFVYGTLMRGRSRERCWPHAPLAVEPATARGTLYDLGPYPAMIAGSDLVAGELWSIAPEHIDETLRVLDAVEGYAGRDSDLYRRVVFDCEVSEGVMQAWMYHYARLDRLQRAHRIEPDADDRCRWP